MSPDPTAIFESLQREFCPPLDSSLVAALVSDLDLNKTGKVSFKESSQINNLRETLSELAAQTDMYYPNERDLDLSSSSTTSNSSAFLHQNGTTDPSSLESSSSTSESSALSFSSPLGFLHAALPHIAMQNLRSALRDVGVVVNPTDMWDVVAGILTADYIREMEERGIEGLDADEIHEPGNVKWQIFQYKKPTGGKRKGNKAKTITLRDLHQKPLNKSESFQRKDSGLFSSDSWTQLSSLSTHLSALLPSHSSSFFQSYFHSPKYPTPYIALRECLLSLCKAYQQPSAHDYTEILFNLLDVLYPDYPTLNYEGHIRFVSDIELALGATGGDGNVSLDVVKLLRELDEDSSSNMEMGAYHCSLPLNILKQNQPFKLGSTSNAPPQFRPNPKPPPSPLNKHGPSSQWQTVRKRNIPQKGHPLAHSIPAYDRKNRNKGSGNTFGQGGKGDVGELSEYQGKIQQNMKRHKDLLRQATWMWQRGNSGNRGGEVARHFAERAREFRDVARRDALDAARIMVESKRISSNDLSTVDLHGTTAVEAVTLVKEILESESPSESRPLKIVTGRGKHSAHKVSVLKPAIRKALEEDGWVVGSWEGGLIVRQKSK